jgi:hypothetical protein
MGRFLPPDHSAGDPNTVGGYRAVHGRPAAFEGKDGASYSVEIVVDDDAAIPPRPFGAYFLFVRWGQGDPVAAGHAESPYLVFAESGEQARGALGAMSLNEAKEQLDRAIDARTPPSRPWYDVMRDEGDDDDGNSNG